MKKHILAISLCLAYLTSNAQPYPEVGKLMPDFILQHIEYFSKKTASLKDFRGKWLLLDFWNRSCAACFASFPHVNEMQKELSGKLQIVMVAIQDAERQVNVIYEKYRLKEGLIMPCAFDSTLSKRFDILVAPYSILIDDKGVVQCITTTIHVDEMKAFLEGEHPSMPKVYRMHEDVAQEENHSLHFNYKQPFAIHNNGAFDSDFLFRSILTKWTPGLNPQKSAQSIQDCLTFTPTAFWELGAPLKDLFFEAYFGKTSPGLKYAEDCEDTYDEPILEIHDTSLFQFSYRTGKNIYSYSVNLPSFRATVAQIQQIMQRDLQLYFGYTASVEKRRMSCWNIIASKDAKEKIRSKGGEPLMEGNTKIGFTARNVPFQNIIEIIRDLNKVYIFNEAAITGDVDLKMDCQGCIMSDILDVRKALKENGLDLVPVEKEMRVLVIREAQ